MGHSQKALFCGIFSSAPKSYTVSITLLLSQDKINSGNSPGHQYRHPDIVVEHERGKDVARHGCKGYGKTALEHPVLKTWKMASFP